MKRILLGLVAAAATASVLYAWTRSSIEVTAGSGTELATVDQRKIEATLTPLDRVLLREPGEPTLQIGLSPELPVMAAIAAVAADEPTPASAPAPRPETIGESTAALAPPPDPVAEPQTTPVAEPQTAVEPAPRRAPRAAVPAGAAAAEPASPRRTVKRPTATASRTAERPRTVRGRRSPMVRRPVRLPPLPFGPSMLDYDANWGGFRD